MSTTRWIPALLGLALLGACDKTPEVAPADAGPLQRDIVNVDAPDVTAAADVPATPDIGAAPDATDGATPDASVADGAASDAADAADVSSIVDAVSSDVTDAATPDGGCVGDGGCWSCPPTTNEHFVNGCTAAACARFDNRARLTRLLADGGLPPLP